ncbi:MAG: ParB/RepB/Spo0J family partition protein [Fidelibacterota bacterium]
MFKLDHISVSGIELESDFFRIAVKALDEKFLESVFELGVISPIIVRKRGEKYQIISGFRRAEGALKSGLNQIPAIVLIEGISDIQCIEIIIALETPISETDTIVKANILKMLVKSGVSRDEIINRFMPLLNLQPSRRLFENLEEIADYPDTVKRYISEVKLSVKRALIFSGMSDEQKNYFIHLRDVLKIGINRLEILVRMSKEISKKVGKDIKSVIEESGINDIVKREDVESAVRYNRVFERLFQIRYPNLHEINRKLHRMRKELKIQPPVEISWDRNLETPGLKISFAFQSLEDLERIGEALLEKRRREIFSEMLKYL